LTYNTTAETTSSKYCILNIVLTLSTEKMNTL